MVSQLIYGQTPTDSTLNNQSDLFDMSLEQLLELDVVDDKFKIYGYIDTYGEKTFNVPTVENGSSKYESVPFEFTPVRNFHIYGSGNINKKIDVLFNLARTSSDGLEVRNAWGILKFIVISYKYVPVKYIEDLGCIMRNSTKFLLLLVLNHQNYLIQIICFWPELLTWWFMVVKILKEMNYYML